MFIIIKQFRFVIFKFKFVVGLKYQDSKAAKSHPKTKDL